MLPGGKAVDLFTGKKALVAFLERIVRDKEFREWYIAEPQRALASYGLREGELADLAHFLDEAAVRGQLPPEVRDALRPLVRTLARMAGAGPQVLPELQAECERLIAEGQRLAAERKTARRARPWWRFWA